MRIDELQRRASAQPEIKQTRTVRVWGPTLRAEVEAGRLKNLAEIYAHPDQTSELQTFRCGHVLGEGLAPETIAAWQARFPAHPLPRDLTELLAQVNGIHLWADLDDGRAYFGVAPLDEWQDAAKDWGWLFTSPPAGYLVISYHDNGDYCLVLDTARSDYWWYDAHDPDNPLKVGSNVEEMLDWLWREAQRLSPS